MSLTHEKLIELYPEDKDAIPAITSEELNKINQFLNGADDIADNIGTGSTICLTPPHKMKTTNATNHGHGTPLIEGGCGYRSPPIPKFPSGTPYTVTLKGRCITLTVFGVDYLYISAKDLVPDGATGVID